MDPIINELVERIERASIQELAELGREQALAILAMISTERQHLQGLIDFSIDDSYDYGEGNEVAYGYSLSAAEHDMVRCQQAQIQLEQVYQI